MPPRSETTADEPNRTQAHDQGGVVDEPSSRPEASDKPSSGRAARRDAIEAMNALDWRTILQRHPGWHWDASQGGVHCPNKVVLEELHKRLSRLRGCGDVRELSVAQSDYHSRWYIPAVRELVARPDFDEDPKWIARILRPAISVRQACHALRTLEALALLVRDPSGRLVQADPLLSTGSGPLSHHVVGFHRAMLDRASRTLDEVARDEREISALTMGVSSEVYRKLQERIVVFRRELLHLAEQPQDVDCVVQINFQLFPPVTGSSMASHDSLGRAPYPRFLVQWTSA